MFLWIDTETTGLKPGKHAVIQIGAFITEDIFGDPIDKFNGICNANGFKVSTMALKVNGITKRDLGRRETTPKQLLKAFTKWMDNHIDRYDRNEKLTPVGYNVRFDVDMLFGVAGRVDYPYLGAYLNGGAIDILALSRLASALGVLDVKNHKLTTLCDALGVDDPGHDALDDILATKEVAKVLVERIRNEEA